MTPEHVCAIRPHRRPHELEAMLESAYMERDQLGHMIGELAAYQMPAPIFVIDGSSEIDPWPAPSLPPELQAAYADVHQRIYALSIELRDSRHP